MRDKENPQVVNAKAQQIALDMINRYLEQVDELCKLKIFDLAFATLENAKQLFSYLNWNEEVQRLQTRLYTLEQGIPNLKTASCTVLTAQEIVCTDIRTTLWQVEQFQKLGMWNDAYAALCYIKPFVLQLQGDEQALSLQKQYEGLEREIHQNMEVAFQKQALEVINNTLLEVFRFLNCNRLYDAFGALHSIKDLLFLRLTENAEVQRFRARWKQLEQTIQERTLELQMSSLSSSSTDRQQRPQISLFSPPSENVVSRAQVPSGMPSETSDSNTGP